MKYSPLIVICLWILVIVGYIMDIVRLCQCDFSSATSWKAEIIYGIGAVSGLGAILGWFDFGV